MTEKYDETAEKKEVAATQETELSGSGVGVDEPEAISGGSQLEVAASTTEDAASSDAADASESSSEPVKSAAPKDGDETAAGAQTSKMAQYDETFVTLEPGQIVEGKVIQIGPDEVMVDVGYKSEGRIPLHELGLKSGESPEEAISVGDVVEVFVLKVEDQEGNVLLSKRRADGRVAWEELEKAKEADEVIEAPVTERVKGGLLVDVGVRGFVPASHVARNYVEDLDRYVGETLRLKVIELDRQRNNVVLSHKDVLEEEFAKAKDEAFSSLNEGVVAKGVVRRITDFGAFVDIGGGVEGLLHVSEMAWSRVRHPSDVVSEGQEVDVMVLKIDEENERISLSLKETLPDPWLSVGQRYKVGEAVKGTVTRVVDFGAFVKLEDGIEGLVHISQLADHHVANPSEVVEPNQEVEVRVVSLDEERRRIGLSMKPPRSESQPSQPRQPRSQGGGRGRGSRGGNSGGGSGSTGGVSGNDTTVTLGDVFEDLSTFFDDEGDDKDDAEEKE